MPDALLRATGTAARARRLIRPPPPAAGDATGLEVRHASRHFYWRAGKRTRRSAWPRLTAVLHTASPLFLSAVVTRGPGPDAGQFRPATKAAVGRIEALPIFTHRGSTGSSLRG